MPVFSNKDTKIWVKYLTNTVVKLLTVKAKSNDMLIPCQANMEILEGVETRIYDLEQIMKSVRWKLLPMEVPNSSNYFINSKEENGIYLWNTKQN